VYRRRNCASSWLPTRIIRRCTVRKILDMMKLVVAFRNVANAPKSGWEDSRGGKPRAVDALFGQLLTVTFVEIN
jgi:hypothetical protein